MAEDIIFKRRDKLRKHFVNTSNVLLYEYKTLSGEAKITFQVIESFDWEDKETGDSKGYVFPAITTLASIRGTSERTIYRHIKNLESVHLLTRQRRSHKASFIFIEDVSHEEANKYMETYVNKPRGNFFSQSSIDKNGSLSEASQLTKMAVDYIKEKELEKDEINVNENLSSKGKGMMPLKDLLGYSDIVLSRRAKTQWKTGDRGIKNKEKRDYLASEIADKLNDQKSLGCFRVIAEKVPQPVIFEAISSIKETTREGKIKVSGGALFVDIIKSYCNAHGIELGFDDKSLIYEGNSI